MSDLKERYENLKSKVTSERRKEFTNLMEFVEKETSYMKAPASIKYHLNKEEGLLEHSVNVAETMLKIKGVLAPEMSDESCVIVALLHDLGKAGVPGYLSASSDDSKDKIKSALKENYLEYGAHCGMFNKWVEGYYQLGNRMAFLKHLKVAMPLGQFEDVNLVLLNFVNDCSHKPTSEEQWKKHYEGIWKEMLGDKPVPEDIINVFFDVSHRGVTQHPKTGEPLCK